MSHEEKKSHFKRCLHKLAKHYKYCAEGAIFLVAGAIASFQKPGPNSPMGRAFAGMCRFLWPLTPVTIAGGLVAGIINTAWGLYALPAAKIKDWQESNKASNNQLNILMTNTDEINNLSDLTTTQLLTALNVTKIHDLKTTSSNPIVASSFNDTILEKEQVSNDITSYSSLRL